MVFRDEYPPKLLAGVADAENTQLLLRKADAAQHETVAAEGFDGVDAHAAHHFLQFVRPGVDEVDEPLVTDVGIEALDELGALGRNAPVALAAVAAAAEVTAERQ